MSARARRWLSSHQRSSASSRPWVIQVSAGSTSVIVPVSAAASPLCAQPSSASTAAMSHATGRRSESGPPGQSALRQVGLAATR